MSRLAMLTLLTSILSAGVLLPGSASAGVACGAVLPGKTAEGADARGNEAGTIPPWTGGLTSPPPGWQPAQGYVDPFAGEKPVFTVTAATAESHRDQLSTGLQALLAKNPAFRMPVYPTHRTAAYRTSTRACVPYPDPKTGLEAITNHLLRDLGGGVERNFDAFVVHDKGTVVRIGFHDQRIYDENFDQSMPGRLFSYIGYFTSPEDLVGTIYLVHEPDPLGAEGRKAWIYNAGQRRVRRAPDLAYDNVQNGSDGLAVVDQYDGYNGRPDLYDWKLIGKRELLVPYNDYAIGDRRVPYGQVLLKGSPNPDLLRFELHRVWAVEARLKTGQSHVYARRVFYLDEDSWSVLLSEAWDARGQLWRVGLHSLVEFYDATAPWYRFELWFDLTNDSYVLTGLDNESKTPWKFGVHGRMVDFQPDALRRAGH
jgi:hypothetical protein